MCVFTFERIRPWKRLVRIWPDKRHSSSVFSQEATSKSQTEVVCKQEKQNVPSKQDEVLDCHTERILSGSQTQQFDIRQFHNWTNDFVDVCLLAANLRVDQMRRSENSFE